MKGFSGFGNSPIKKDKKSQPETKPEKTWIQKQAKKIWKSKKKKVKDAPTFEKWVEEEYLYSTRPTKPKKSGKGPETLPEKETRPPAKKHEKWFHSWE
mgnify:CR=1 FL=1